MPRGLVTAFRTLSILPVPGGEDEAYGSSLFWFPVVGLVLSLLLLGLAGLSVVLIGRDWPGGTAFIVVAGGIVLTGALHMDGLADWADSLGCSHDRERMLAVMKDSRTGVFGVLALVLTVTAKWLALTVLVDQGLLLWLVAAYLVSRTVIVDLAVWLPYARPEGGTGSGVAGEARTVHRAVSMLICLAVLVFLFGLSGCLMLAAGLAAGRLFGLWCRSRIGGITGDLMGAASEIVETAMLFAGAAWGTELMHMTRFSFP